MNVLWTKEKYHKIFSTENLNLHASGDGVVASHSCRLCGGNTDLRAFADTHSSEGVEERYDQILYDCFGVRVSPADCLICEWCVRQLRNTERFRALVNAAFEKTSSSSTCTPNTTPQIQKTEPNNMSITTSKDIIDLLKNKMAADASKNKRQVDRKMILNPNNEARRANVQCVTCKQKYLMMVKSEVQNNFICSRCNKFKGKKMICKKCEVEIPVGKIREHLDTHNYEDKEDRRLISLPKPSQIKRKENNLILFKYRCPACSKRYSTAQLLTDHTTRVHGEGERAQTVTRKNKTRDLTSHKFSDETKVVMRRNHSLKWL